MRQYFVRIGVLGEIRLASALIPIERFRRVVIRSPRGIEVGEVISPHRPQPSGERESATETAYRILRPTTESDSEVGIAANCITASIAPGVSSASGTPPGRSVHDHSPGAGLRRGGAGHRQPVAGNAR